MARADKPRDGRSESLVVHSLLRPSAGTGNDRPAPRIHVTAQQSRRHPGGRTARPSADGLPRQPTRSRSMRKLNLRGRVLGGFNSG